MDLQGRIISHHLENSYNKLENMILKAFENKGFVFFNRIDRDAFMRNKVKVMTSGTEEDKITSLFVDERHICTYSNPRLVTWSSGPDASGVQKIEFEIKFKE